MISNAFGLEIEGGVARALSLEGLGVCDRVLSQLPDQLSEVSQKTLGVLIVGSSHISRLVEGTAAAAEGEDLRYSEPRGPIINLSASDDTAEGNGSFRAQELALHVVDAAAYDERDVFGGVGLGAAEVVLQIR